MADYPAKRGANPNQGQRKKLRQQMEQEGVANLHLHQHQNLHVYEAPAQPPLNFSGQQRLKVETRNEQWELEGLGFMVGLPAFIGGSAMAIMFGLWFSGLFFHAKPDGSGGAGAGWFFTWLISTGLAWVPCMAIFAVLWMTFWGLILAPFWAPALVWIALIKRVFRNLGQHSQDPALR